MKEETWGRRMYKVLTYVDSRMVASRIVAKEQDVVYVVCPKMRSDKMRVIGPNNVQK